MTPSKITPDILENYAAQFKKIETCIHDFQVVLNQKNVDDLIWVMQRIDSFKNIYHENFISEITDDLKERKLGKSLNEIKLHICSNRLLLEIDRIINIEIMDKYKIIKSVGEGTFGSVSKAVNTQTNEVVAIKSLKIN
jgi:hypothetical protein